MCEIRNQIDRSEIRKRNRSNFINRYHTSRVYRYTFLSMIFYFLIFFIFLFYCFFVFCFCFLFHNILSLSRRLLLIIFHTYNPFRLAVSFYVKKKSRPIPPKRYRNKNIEKNFCIGFVKISSLSLFLLLFFFSLYCSSAK